MITEEDFAYARRMLENAVPKKQYPLTWAEQREDGWWQCFTIIEEGADAVEIPFK